LTSDNTSIGVSHKIGEARAGELLSLARSLCGEERDYGIVIRTNADSASNEEVSADITYIQSVYKKIKTEGAHCTGGSLIHRSMPGYLARLKSQDTADIDLIYTDQQDIYEEIAGYLPGLSESGLLKYYDDPAVSLSTLYHLRGNMEELLGKKVWLPSGANIIIEQLETLTVIDVNTGKNISRKPEVLFSVNREAAVEIARQLKLRNISGMIIVDFINMSSKEQEKELISLIRRELKKDNVPAHFVDITKLGLVEITRKKTYKSLREMLDKPKNTC
jgi:ribonuclease G